MGDHLPGSLCERDVSNSDWAPLTCGRQRCVNSVADAIIAKVDWRAANRAVL